MTALPEYIADAARRLAEIDAARRLAEIEAAGWGCYVCAALPGFAGAAASAAVVRPGQPACFGSDPNKQAFAENVCDACPYAHRCLDI